MNKMRILHLIDSMGLGGAQVVLKNLFEAQNQNNNIHIYALRTLSNAIKIDHPNIHIFPSQKRYSFAPVLVLRRFIIEHKIDVLHCHLFRSQCTGWLLKKFFFPNIKLVFHEHGPIFRNFAPWIVDQMLVGLLKISKPDVFRYIAISKNTKQRLLERANLDPSKIEVVSNAVNLKQFNTNVEVSHPKLIPLKNSTKFTIGYVGRLSVVKGCCYLIEAIKLLDKYDDIELIIVGDGELKQELKQLANTLGVDDKVTFIGYIDKPEQAYTLFDVLVVSSIYEAFGNIIIEAQACGIPVISTKTVGPSEIIINEKNGILCVPKNALEIANKIELVYQNPSLKDQIISNALKNINTFSTDHFVRNIDQVYLQP